MSPHFRHISLVTKATKLVNGKLLKTALIAKYEAIDTRTDWLGAKELATLAWMYSGEYTTVDVLKVQNPQQEIDAELFKCLDLYTEEPTKRNVHALWDYLESVDGLTEKT